ncbi:cupin domain-containing protein [Lysinibacillus sp. 54212]|uniref:cupin domain-containing protein n=1 Tax=Lysinibacillus sp. 54212 TaxID=3119829 RepID=UPI002FCB093F
MEFFELRRGEGIQVTHFNSNFCINQFIQLKEEAKISLITLKENGIIGYHQAVVPQLLYILQGEALVRNEDNKLIPLHEGEAVLWCKGEWHETVSKKGITAIVIESKELNTSHVLLPSMEMKK